MPKYKSSGICMYIKDMVEIEISEVINDKMQTLKRTHDIKISTLHEC
jgi:hypothetical protein